MFPPVRVHVSSALLMRCSATRDWLCGCCRGARACVGYPINGRAAKPQATRMVMMVHTTVGHGASEPYSALSSSRLGMIRPPSPVGPTVGNAQGQPASAIPEPTKTEWDPASQRLVLPGLLGQRSRSSLAFAADLVCPNGNAGAADLKRHSAEVRGWAALVCWRQ